MWDDATWSPVSWSVRPWCIWVSWSHLEENVLKSWRDVCLKLVRRFYIIRVAIWPFFKLCARNEMGWPFLNIQEKTTVLGLLCQILAHFFIFKLNFCFNHLIKFYLKIWPFSFSIGFFKIAFGQIWPYNILCLAALYVVSYKNLNCEDLDKILY